MLFKAPSTDQSAEALKLAPGGRASTELVAQAFIQQLLRDLPLSQHKCQSILPGPKTLLINRFDLLLHVSSEVRIDFFKRLLSKLVSSSTDTSFLLSSLTCAGWTLTTQERSALLIKLSQEKKTSTISRAWIALARSAKTFSEAHKIIRDCDPRELLARRSSELKEYVATILLLNGLRKIDYPDQISKFSFNRDYLDTIEGRIRNSYATCLHFLKQHKPLFENTARYKKLNQLFKDSLAAFTTCSKQPLSPAERNQWLRCELLKLDLEIKFGLSFDHAPAEAHLAKPWHVSELEIIHKVLLTIGEYRIIASPSLVGFRRWATLIGENAHINTGDSSEDGLIYLPDLAFNVRAREDNWGRTPEDLIFHEVGHALSMRPWGIYKFTEALRKDPDSVSIEDLFLPDHFPSIFLPLSRWHMVTRAEAHKLDLERSQVTLKLPNRQTRTVALGAPVTIDGKQRTYEYVRDLKTLMWYDSSKGEFPTRFYSRADPTETISELYTAYFSSDRTQVFELIQNAPRLFLLMEALYHRFHGDNEAKIRLEEALETHRNSSSSRHCPSKAKQELGLFTMLAHSEQVKLLESAEIPVADPLDVSSIEKGFSRALRRDRGKIHLALRHALQEYKPALLWARALLEANQDVCVVSIRGTTEQEQSAQEPIRDLLEEALGDRFDASVEGGAVYFLNDYARSHRLGDSYHQKLETLLPQLKHGLSPRSNAGVKVRETSYDRVCVYSAIPATLHYLRKYIARTGTRKQYRVIDPRTISVDFALDATLHNNPQLYPPKTLHLFTLEETLVNLPAEYRITLKGTSTVFDRLSFREFLAKPSVNAWKREVAAVHKIDIARLEFDPSDFMSRRASRRQIKESPDNSLFKDLHRR